MVGEELPQMGLQVRQACEVSDPRQAKRSLDLSYMVLGRDIDGDAVSGRDSFRKQDRRGRFEAKLALDVTDKSLWGDDLVGLIEPTESRDPLWLDEDRDDLLGIYCRD